MAFENASRVFRNGSVWLIGCLWNFSNTFFCSGTEKGVGDLSTKQVSKSPPPREETKRRQIQPRPCWQPFSCSRRLFVCTPKGTDWVDYGYGHSFSIFFPSFPSSELAGRIHGQKNGRGLLPLQFLWFGWGWQRLW